MHEVFGRVTFANEEASHHLRVGRLRADAALLARRKRKEGVS